MYGHGREMRSARRPARGCSSETQQCPMKTEHLLAAVRQDEFPSIINRPADNAASIWRQDYHILPSRGSSVEPERRTNRRCLQLLLSPFVHPRRATQVVRELVVEAKANLEARTDQVETTAPSCGKPSHHLAALVSMTTRRRWPLHSTGPSAARS